VILLTRLPIIAPNVQKINTFLKNFAAFSENFTPSPAPQKGFSVGWKKMHPLCFPQVCCQVLFLPQFLHAQQNPHSPKNGKSVFIHHKRYVNCFVYPQDVCLWKRAVEKAVEIVEKLSFSTATRCFSNPRTHSKPLYRHCIPNEYSVITQIM
jgi:hypothetical protein